MREIPVSSITKPDKEGYYMSPWMYRILKGQNTTIFTGIKDPTDSLLLL